MERAKAIELLKNAVPARGYEVGPFIEAVCMAISALEGKDTNVLAKWIPVSEKTGLLNTRGDEIVAWMPLPEPYRKEP